MRDDELQVLGEPRKMSKREKWWTAIVAFSLLAIIAAIGTMGYFLTKDRQEEKVTKKTGDRG